MAEEARALVEWGRGDAVVDSAGANEPAAFRNMKGCPGERKRQPALQNDFEDSRVYLHPHSINQIDCNTSTGTNSSDSIFRPHRRPAYRIMCVRRVDRRGSFAGRRLAVHGGAIMMPARGTAVTMADGRWHRCGLACPRCTPAGGPPPRRRRPLRPSASCVALKTPTASPSAGGSCASAYIRDLAEGGACSVSGPRSGRHAFGDPSSCSLSSTLYTVGNSRPGPQALPPDEFVRPLNVGSALLQKPPRGGHLQAPSEAVGKEMHPAVAVLLLSVGHRARRK